MSLLRTTRVVARTRNLALSGRNYATTSRLLALASLVRAPTKADADGVELVSSDEARLLITETAAERLRQLATGGDATKALRIAVESGGCHGYQYKLEVARTREPDDYHFTHPSITPSNVYVDPISLGLLKGSTIDFKTEHIGSSFRITDNPQSKDSGCGCGVSWEAKF